MLFCQPSTPWPQLEAFLARCFYTPVPALFVLVHVEALGFALQARIVSAVRDARAGGRYRLVLLVRARSSSGVHVLQEVPTLNCRPPSAAAAEGLVRALMGSQVHVVSSAAAGLGKTQAIHAMARAQRRRLVTVPLSGPLEAGALVKRLQGCDLRAPHALHLDVGVVQNPGLLSDILFQLLALRVLQSPRHLFPMPCASVYLELGNASDGPLAVCDRRLLDPQYSALVPATPRTLCAHDSGHQGSAEALGLSLSFFSVC